MNEAAIRAEFKLEVSGVAMGAGQQKQAAADCRATALQLNVKPAVGVLEEMTR